MPAYIIPCQFLFGVLENIFSCIKFYKFAQVHKANLV